MEEYQPTRLERFLQSHPEASIYWLGLVTQVYLTWNLLPTLREPGSGRWVSLGFLLPMQLMAGAIVVLIAKLTRAMHLHTVRDREVKAAELEVAAVLAERAVREQAAELEALKANHDPLNCPGPTEDLDPVLTADGVIVDWTWVCPTCQLRWRHLGEWRAP